MKKENLNNTAQTFITKKSSNKKVEKKKKKTFAMSKFFFIYSKPLGNQFLFC